MPRAREIGISIGVLPTGPTNSVLDVAGVGLGHVTLLRDEAPPPEGRGTARTGVTTLLLAEDAYTRPLAAGGAVLNGAGECTGFLTAAEWAAIETPVYLTSTMQLGRVYDAACQIALQRHPDVAGEVVIPVVGECDDSFLNDCRVMQVETDDVRRRTEAASLAGGSDATGRGRSRRRDRDVLPRLQGRHRYVVAGHARRAHRRGAAAHQLRRAQATDRRRRPGRTTASGRRRRTGRPAGSCIGIVSPTLPSSAPTVRGWRAGSASASHAPARPATTAAERSSSPPRPPAAPTATVHRRTAPAWPAEDWTTSSRPWSTRPRRRSSTRCSAPRRRSAATATPAKDSTPRSWPDSLEGHAHARD